MRLGKGRLMRFKHPDLVCIVWRCVLYGDVCTSAVLIDGTACHWHGNTMSRDTILIQLRPVKGFQDVYRHTEFCAQPQYQAGIDDIKISLANLACDMR
jgi:hypothetical protein